MRKHTNRSARAQKAASVAPGATIKRKKLASTSSWLVVGLALSAFTAVLATPALALPPPPPPLPDLTNPVTGTKEAIVQNLTADVDLTQDGNAVLRHTTKNSNVILPKMPGVIAGTYTILDTTTNGSGVVTSVKVENTTTHAISTISTSIAYSPTTVINPATGAPENVIATLSQSTVVTDHGNAILTAQAAGDVIYVPGPTGGLYTVTVPNPDGTTHRITSVDAEDSSGNTFTFTTRINNSSDLGGVPHYTPGSGGGAGSTSPLIYASPAGDVYFKDANVGADGAGGHDGGGVRICFGILGCITIAYSPTSGDPGSPGATIDDTVNQTTLGANHNLHTVTDKTPGITVSSTGGNGGSGGDAYGNIDAAPGGVAGVGGNVTLHNYVDISTYGVESHGIFAQSRAGRGGEGGTGYIASTGGGGGSAAQAGTVTVYNYGTIYTQNTGAIGIEAQSLGGAAGSGGDSYGIIGEGGGGSSGGNGSTVYVDNEGTIQTMGDEAHGILAQSIGGSGGNGGTSGGLVAFGDSGSAGGNGGDVTVVNGGEIDTWGVHARGIFAQSIGGGGGTGGDSTGLAAVGGGGGKGSLAGTVTVDNKGVIATHKNQSSGIFAQSVGGGGGDGGSSGGVFLSVGGSGDSGGPGGHVTVNNVGSITTQGNDSHGIFAQSVGGGGGNGGSSTSVSAFAGVAIGGDGALGGNGGQVDVTFKNRTQEGYIFTAGDRSRGIFAQSVGGGGGTGGMAAQVSVGIVGAVSLAIGGHGGGGGTGGTVNIGDVSHCLTASTCYNLVKDDVAIITQGDNSEGMYIQSVGGGGGGGGYAISAAGSASLGPSVSLSMGIGGSAGNGGAGGDVTVRTGGSIQTGTVGGAFVTRDGVQTTEVRNDGAFSTGFLAQSVGGGGGKGGFSISASLAAGVTNGVALAGGVGGTGGLGGIGGKVDADFDGSITTYGDDADGAIIQSVGGGGGAGGYNISASIGVGGVAGAAASVGVGGSGGAGSAGGTVYGTVGGDVHTVGARSTGVLVQSVGGGGGDGGFNISGSIGAGGGAGVGIAVGVGGSGAGGGGGGHVEGKSLGQIVTEGADSGGLLVQSIGGGGGNGGFNVSGSIGAGGVAGGAISVGVGGKAGTGSDGGYVKGDALGLVLTGGNDSAGVTVQSLGGGGGNGGFAVAGGIGAGGTAGGAINLAIGGSGGGGGTGGEVHGSAVSIGTTGDDSDGFLTQSVGGGGGNGGFSIGAGIGGGGTAGGAISLSIGGSGATGGSAGHAYGTVTGLVSTTGKNSTGVTVQSLGGGGGNGGFSVAGGIGGGGTGGGAISVGLGGSGGLAGNGGEVDASAASITTTNDNSGGFLAQSVGGGGGNGGFSVAGSIGGGGTGGGAISVGIGGSGAGGGFAQRVGATVTGDVYTGGKQSDAIIAQSLGGGGGNGGFTVAGSIGVGGTGGGAASVGVGGSGGGGGDSGKVTLSVTGTTETVGANSNGIIAQSVGGGGGNGGFSVAGSIAAGGTGAGTIGVSVGGSGGHGGNVLDKVKLDVTGTTLDPDTDDLVAVVTHAAGSRAVLAQSVGGGGGNGGFSVVGAIALANQGAGNVGVGVGGSGGTGGYAGNVEGNVTGDVATFGDSDAEGVLVQSIGGGGGNGGFSIAGGIAASTKGAGNLLVGVGGMGGDGGASGEVRGTVTGNVTTIGDNSAGVTYQSLAGGGGNGGFNITGGVALTASGSGGAGNIGVGVGGFGGNGSDAKLVDATIIGDISTGGDKSYGALMQSVGGGGGSGGFNITGTFQASTAKGGSIGFGLGGFGGDGGNSSTVTGTLTGNVHTIGNDAYGVMLQSLGGGGGNGGFNVTASATLTSGANGSLGVGIGGFGGSGGHSDNVTGTITGDYLTEGVNSGGVIVQSLGGGGGNGGMNVTGALSVSAKGSSGQASIGIGGFGGSGGYAGTATLVRTGDTQTTGADSQAILVQSVGGGGGNGGINVSGGIVASKSDNASINIGLGGFGGDASYADTVTATIVGNVWATGLGAGQASDQPGLFTGAVVAQSVGGGGGTGGLNVSGGISLAKSGSTGKVASIGIGGFGGGGGDGGAVNLDIHAPSTDPVQVVAVGDNRAAVVAQSLGGGGGIGGINVSGGISTNSSLAFGMGGFGGDGGLAKDVTADVTADLWTTGDGTRGLLAQSLGGGGGAGGINVSGTVNINSSDDTSVTFGLGGFGGNGNISGVVRVAQKGTIFVDGKNGIGILAQSVAGGGGDGGLNVSANIANASTNKTTKRIIAGVGGSAGDGANAGAVILNSVGAIVVNGPASTSPDENPDDEQTTVFDSAGVLAQSIGGGGGLGGMNISASVARNAGNTLQFGMGGSGGAGGDADTVTVTRGYDTTPSGLVADASYIDTVGDFSSGLVAQSVGGGGGMAGMNFNFAYNNQPKAEGDDASNKSYKAAIISVGGDGGSAGNGKAVTVKHDGDIYTDGVDSHGIVAQSIGGGGGDSNVNLGAGALGGKTKSMNIGVGGANGAAGQGDLVDVDHVGNIYTLGDGSIGIKAQSIGGGGGSVNSVNQYVDPILDFVTGQMDSASIAVNVGRKGGTGGIGGEVRVKSNGGIFTAGDDAMGIFAQSVGGGGGDSGTTTVGGDFESKSGAYGGNVAVGLDGGTSATGGMVTVNTDGVIETEGTRAHAIFAQSLGGGGGMGGTVGDKLALSSNNDPDGPDTTTTADINVGGNGGDGSFAQQVTVSNAGGLLTFGDHSDGIWAQSIGGSGGDGGDYMQASIENIGSGKTTRSFSFNIGGTGGTGAKGGGVTVTNTGFIQTTGVQSFGVRAESIGGGGGDGGAVSQGTLQTGSGSLQTISINVGGHGGHGGTGGDVMVTNEGEIFTQEVGAEGIRATSTGGGGGNAGVIINTLMAVTGSESQTQSVAMNFGNDGGTGGTGGAVTVNNTATAVNGSGEIWTQGDSAHGIFAQSLGGGGGNGSSIVTMTGLRSTKDSFAVGLNLGGKGGSGNIGQTVTVDNSGSIETDGKNAYGILAQSTGGGGGNGGLVLSAAAAFGAKANAPVLSIGGNGGDGGDGGEVDVTNTGSILTTGAGSHGIVAQSIGGGGGNAGAGITATNDAASFVISNTLALVAGATGGGTGGAGGIVKVVQDGDVTVTGEGAQAVDAESINGGGGHLDFDLTGVTGMPGFSFKSVFADAFGLTPSDDVTDPAIDTRLGGVDISDMNAGKVTVTTTGNFGVAGDNGIGSFNQSLGGGGGSLHLKTDQASATSADTDPTAISYSVSLGGANGTNNSGANLEGQRSGYVLTTGVDALGVLSQTIGGGGGHAVVDITGEDGALVGPVTVSFGSTNGNNETGGDILRSENGAVTTTENLSTAIIAQSIGGGGGAASLLLNDNSVTPFSVAAVHSGIHPVSSAPAPASVILSFGANGGTGLDAGTINSPYSGGAGTIGDHALGLLVQAIGAGGGETSLDGFAAADITLGGSGSASGNGGDITIVNSGDVQTEGVGSHGVFLQSIGGGGGAVFGAGPGSTVTLSSANIGNGGAISLTQTGSVWTTGENANGIIAQSLGGGGGWVDDLFAGTAGGAGKGGAITLTLDSGVAATGDGSTAVWAQSVGGQGGGNITVNASSMVRGNAAGVAFDGGATNTLTTSGTVSAVSGLAISATNGNDSVLNDGVVVGNVDLGSGANSFDNRTGSTFVAYSLINLSGSTPAPTANFTNAGDFQMGLSAPRVPIDLANGTVFDTLDAVSPAETNLMYGARVINTVALNGNFVQTDTGHMAFDVAFGPYASDKVNVSGKATVAGTGTVTLTFLGNSDPVTLFAAAGGGTDNGLKIDDTLAMDYSVKANTQGIQLAYTSHFAQPFLNRNERALGGHMDSALLLGNSNGIGRTMALIGNFEAGQENQYTEVMTELNPEPFVAPLLVQQASADRFADDLFGCATAAGSADRSCTWGHVETNGSLHSGNFETFQSASDGHTLSTGFERPLNDRWSVAVAVGYDRINSLDVDATRAHSDGQSVNLGAGLRRLNGDGSDLGLSLSSGWQTLDTTRRVTIFDTEIGTSRPETSFLKAAFTIGKTWRSGNLYARPVLNLSETALHQSAFAEQGLAGDGIAGAKHTQYIASGGPELTLGVTSPAGSDYMTRLEVNAGRDYRDVSRIAMPYRLIGANPASDPALVGTDIGHTNDKMGVTLDVTKAGSRMSVQLSYKQEASEKFRSHTIGASFRLKF